MELGSLGAGVTACGKNTLETECPGFTVEEEVAGSGQGPAKLVSAAAMRVDT